MSSRCLYPAAPWMPPLDVHQAQTINTSNPTQHLPKPTPPLVSLPQCWHHHPARLLGQKSAHHPGPPPASPQPCPIWPSGLPQLTNYLLCFAPTFIQASIISSSESPPHWFTTPSRPLFQPLYHEHRVAFLKCKTNLISLLLKTLKGYPHLQESLQPPGIQSLMVSPLGTSLASPQPHDLSSASITMTHAFFLLPQGL